MIKVSAVSGILERMPGQATRRHPELPAYRCFLSDLTGFTGFRRAGPTRTRSVAYQMTWALSMSSQARLCAIKATATITTNRTKNNTTPPQPLSHGIGLGEA